MDEGMLNKIVPVKAYGLEKKAFRDGASFIGSSREEGAKTYSINILYENMVDPADNAHKFAVLPENPQFAKISKYVDDAGIELNEFPLEKLSDSLKDMYGAWVVVDLSKTPVCRVYSENVSKLQDGQVVTVHKAGDLMHKKDPKTGKDTDELAIMTQVPVWGFCRKAPNGNWVWLKDNDPMVRIQREINQGRLRYVELEKDFTVNDGPGTGEEKKPAEEAPKEDAAPKIAGDASTITGIG
ncbi:MAG: hypothetical protein VZR53_00725 [Prevotella sp.]|nr:hypothetical protein [Prevotella sp.]